MALTEEILPISKKALFNPTPLYVSISSTDVATVWRKADTNVYVVAGKYIGLIRDGEVVKGHKYTKLTEEEKKIVIEAVKQQNRDAVIRFDFEE